MKINEFLLNNRRFRTYDDGMRIKTMYPRVRCADGFSISIQAGECLHCSPRLDVCDFYTEVEAGHPSSPEPDLLQYAKEPYHPTETVYAWVPVSVIDAILEKHGGIIA